MTKDTLILAPGGEKTGEGRAAHTSIHAAAEAQSQLQCYGLSRRCGCHSPSYLLWGNAHAG